MAFEIGQAYVKVTPDTKGFESKVRSSIGSSVMEPLDSLGGSINRKIGGALKFGVGSAIAGLGVAITKGFGRLRAIDDAESKLRGLGHSAAGVETIMDSALASVKGTAFGLGEAATIAAGAVASGIEPGEELTRVLSTTADAAAIAGIGLDEMGAIFNKVAANNKMGTEEMNQILDRGIPILQWLQEEYNITAEEARAMVSAGEVDFATFQKLMEDNIGGAAVEMGDSFSGAFANMGAAAGRFGALLIGPIFENLKGFFKGVISWFDSMAPHAERIGQIIGEKIGGAVQFISGAFKTLMTGDFPGFAEMGIEEDSPIVSGLLMVRDAIMEIIDWVKQASAFYDRHQEAIKKIGAAVVPAAAGIAAFASAFNLLKKVWMGLQAATPLGLILALASALVYAYQNSETFRNIINNAFAAIKNFIGPIIEVVRGWISGFGDTNMEVGDRVGGIWDQLVATFGSAIDAIVAIFTFFSDIAIDIWERFGTHILTFITGTVGRILQVISGVLKVIQGVFEIFAGAFTGDWRRMWDGVKMIFSGLWNAIKAILAQTFEAIKTILGAFVAVFTAMWGALWDRIKQMARAVWDGIKNYLRTNWNLIKDTASRVFGAIRDFISNIFGRIRDIARDVWNRIKSTISDAINGAKDSVRNTLDTVITFFSGLWGRISAHISGFPGKMLQMGKDMISGMANGVAAMAGSLLRRVKDTINAPINWAKKKLGLRSPSKLFEEFGAMTGEGMARGIEGMANRVTRATDKMLPTPRTVPMGARGGVPAAATAGGGGLTINGDIIIPAEDIEQMKSVIDFFDKVGQTARRGVGAS